MIKKFDFRVLDSTRCRIIWVQFEDKNVGVANRTKYSQHFTDSISKAWTSIF